MRYISTLLLVVLILTSANAQKAKLSLKLEQDKTYKQVSHTKATINQDVYGMKMNIEIIMDASMSFLVKAVNKEGYDMDLRYERMNMTMELPRTTMEFSSEKNDESDLFSSILAQMKDKPLKMKMNKRGEITEIEDVESRWEEIINQFDQFPEQERQQVKSQLLNTYGEKGIKGSIETFTAIFPEKPVKKGAQWNIITNLEAGMSSTLNITYTYEGSEDEFVLISGLGSVETMDKETYVETNGMSMKYDLSGTISSSIKMDKKTGWIHEASLEQSIEGTATIKANDQLPDGMTIPMTITNETKVSSESLK
jgi:hypothetical protein